MMKSSSRLVKSGFALPALLAIVWPLSVVLVCAQRGSQLSQSEERGKQIYLRGESESGEIKAVLDNGALEAPAKNFPCANCHGLGGEGSNEKELQTPSIVWRALTASRQFTAAWPGRRRYNKWALARAITLGIDSNGRKIHAAMPRYQLSNKQTADLIAYLKRFGDESENEVGLSEDVIKVGTVLPMTGPLAGLGRDLKQTLAACFNEVNSQGGIYGRKFELVVADSRGDLAGTAAGTRWLVEKEKVFALVGNFLPGNKLETSEFLKQREVPLVGPVTLSPRLPTLPNQFVFYLLPSFSEQARSLVDFIAAAETQPRDKSTVRVVAVYSDNRFDQDALAGLRSQAKVRSMQIAAEQRYDSESSVKDTVQAVAAQKPQYIFFFGNGDDFITFAHELDRLKLDADLLTCASMVGVSAFDLPASVASRTHLSYSASFPEEDDFAEFLAVMQKGGVQLRSAAFQAVAYAGAKIFVDAVKSSGRRLNRAGLLNSLEHLQDFRTGVLPPVTFSANRRIGVTGSYIVGIDLARKRYLPLGNRIVPQDGNP